MEARTVMARRDGQTYVIRYAEGCELQAVDEVMRLADDPSCPRDWGDVALLGLQITCQADDSPLAGAVRRGALSPLDDGELQFRLSD